MWVDEQGRWRESLFSFKITAVLIEVKKEIACTDKGQNGKIIQSLQNKGDPTPFELKL